MADQQPYNEIGQILASGGDQAVGLAYSAGWGESQIDAMINRRWNLNSGGGFLLLKALGRKGSQAGRLMNGLDPDDDVPLDDMPINPSMPGGGVEGNRFRWIAEVTPGGEGSPAIVRGWGNGSESIEDLYELAWKTAHDMFITHFAKFSIKDPELMQAGNIEFLFSGKAF